MGAGIMRITATTLTALAVLLLALPAAAIVEVTPDEGHPGEELSVDVVGDPFIRTYEPGFTIAFDPDADIDVNFTYRAYDKGDERLRAQIQIHSNALPGHIDVLVLGRMGEELERARNAFEILGTAALISATPGALRQGTSASVTITGTSTHFDLSISQISVGSSGVQAEITSVSSDTRLTARFTVDDRASLGWRDVTVTTDIERAEGRRLIEVVEQPGLKRTDPDVLDQGQSTELVIIGSGTEFADGDAVGISGGGVSVLGASERLSNTKLRVKVDVDSRAAPGPRTVSVTTGGEVLTGADLLTIEAHISLTPDELVQNNEESFQAVGGEGWFDNGLVVSAGERVDVDSVFYHDPYSATFSATAEPNAVVGPRKVTFSVDGQSVTGTLTVKLNPNTTKLDTITPDSADAGVVDLPVTVQGTNTNFESGVTTLEGGDGVLVGHGFAAGGETQATGLLDLADDAPAGAIDVTAVTRYERVTLDSGFTVTQPAVVESVQPGLIDAGASETVTVTATGGGFVEGATRVFVSGENVTVDAVRVLAADSLEADVTVGAEAEGTVRVLKAVTGARAAIGGALDVFHPSLSADTPALWESRPTKVDLRAVDFDLSADPALSFEPPEITVSGITASGADHLSFSAHVPAGLGVREATLTVTVAGRSLAVDFTVRALPAADGGDGGCGCGSGAGRGAPVLSLLLLGLVLSRSRRAG